MAALTAETRKWILASLAKNVSKAQADSLLRCGRPAKEIFIAITILNQRSITVGKALKEARKLIAGSSR